MLGRVTPLLLIASLLAPAADSLRLVESSPVETSLDHPDLPQTADVWVEMIEAAREDLALAHFYASTAEDSDLERVIAALTDAGARGVRVRFLVADTFRKTYPQVPERLAALDGVELRWLDFGDGVMHAKYLVVDGREAFLGSPNFDYRALTHIQELGVQVRSTKVARAALDVFERDWASAGGEPVPWPRAARGMFPVTLSLDGAQAGEHESATRVTPMFSPRGRLPDESLWDLPRLVAAIEGARSSVRVQVLTYDAVGRDRAYFPDLEQALRSAAARGVAVQLLVADWGKRPGVVEGLQSLACLEGIEVRFVVVPDWSGGHVPFARVAHPKLLVVDEVLAWVGSSNWERTYFTTSRNAGLLLEGPAIGARLAEWFDHTWGSEYAEEVVPGRAYEPRRR
jgi:phosphatidylserine/phosphatidylglycerophosphate/cardiolipin synthase-like enzyme